MCAICGCGGHSAAHDHRGRDLHGHEHNGFDHHGQDREAHGHHAHGHERRTNGVEHGVLTKNARRAAENRRAIAAKQIAVYNLLGSAGAGKTSLLEVTIRRLALSVQVAVLEGDPATDEDAKRIAQVGCPVVQINTGACCHLDASMVADGLGTLAPARASLVFVENVGNLVCPALFDLGERARILVMSVAEGEDKPLEYPRAFRAADVLVLTKIDLQPLVGLDEERCFANARKVNPAIRIVRVSAKTGEGIDELCELLCDDARAAWAAGWSQPAAEVHQ